jgi:hypothetical protein
MGYRTGGVDELLIPATTRLALIAARDLMKQLGNLSDGAICAMKNADNNPHYRACNLCEAICGIEISVHAEQRLHICGDKADPFSKG